MTTTAITTKTTTDIAVPMNEAWGADGIDKKDILISKILVMQGLSKLVAAEKAQMGDIMDSVNQKTLGTCRKTEYKAVAFVPLMSFKTWIEFEELDGKLQFLRIIPMDATNSDLPLRETDAEGREIVRDRCLNFYVMLESELSSADAIPYLLSFRRTSYNAGRALITHFARCAKAKVPPASRVFELGGIKTTNDKGTFYVSEVTGTDRTLPKEQLAVCYDWFRTIQSSEIKIDNSDLEAEAEVATEPKRKAGEVRKNDEF